MRAAVVVLGDLTRSPRTVLHALALANAGLDVDLVGFAEPGWRPKGATGRLQVRPLPSAASGAGASVPYAARAASRGIALCWHLTRLLLWGLPSPDLILVQNPPGVPTLAVAWVAARLRAARFAIDWHNLTWSMLALRLGKSHALVTCTSAYERFFSRRADVNLFVSAAMRERLADEWGIGGLVFRDRPAAAFTPLDGEARQTARQFFLKKLGVSGSAATLVVSSTSWSADEDFELLYAALVEYDQLTEAALPETVPSLIVAITGRGPLRDAFETRFAQAQLKHSLVRMLWLEAEEYPRLLAAADLGVCLHSSSSGLDLPMKILDMFGAGLPVCALNYAPCLRELVVEGVNGLLFETGSDLAALLHSISTGGGERRLHALRTGVRESDLPNWESAWRIEIGDALTNLHGSPNG